MTMRQNGRWPGHLKTFAMATAVFLGLLFVLKASLHQGAALGLDTKPKMIFFVTPTHRRMNRLADMTRLANTLRQVPALHWIVVEDGDWTVKAVDDILRRSQLPYTYLAGVAPGVRRSDDAKGWWQRNTALEYLRNNTKKIVGPDLQANVYFGDDDNTYDLRLFEECIRRVERLGVWPVGSVGGVVAEAPIVENNVVVDWLVRYLPSSPFPVDIAAFAISLDIVISKNPRFEPKCVHGRQESCFLLQCGVEERDIDAFGVAKPGHPPQELYVWHTRTVRSSDPPWDRPEYKDYVLDLE
ncbi:unnamed protein product, partial [Mesorhabditis spiculigera]